ncbi:MAG: hypothetical protein M3O35_09170 [Acidobacteriota bacterium]|nr:hypothetical protein [Acidobacteriota bacterium]
MAAKQRFTTHKQRTDWFGQRSAYPFREASSKVLEEYAKKHLDPPAGEEQWKWECAGPFNIAGRVTSLVIQPKDPNLKLAGAAAGGVWRSTDGGRNWNPSWPKWASQNIGSLAQDPADPKHIYCGTGEANLSVDCYPGTGILQSHDFGLTWPLEKYASATQQALPRRIGVIAVDPFDSQHVLAGGVTHDEGDPGGLFTSTDGGLTWKPGAVGISASSYWCHSIVFHPTRQGTIFAAVTARGALNGIWRTEDGGGSWVHLAREGGHSAGGLGLPPPDQFHRTSLAVAPSSPDTIYALAGDNHYHVLGVYCSKDRGEIWHQIGGRHFSHEKQMFHNNTIAVHPHHPEFVICGGVDLHLTRNGGEHWVRATDRHAPETGHHYAHGDHHAVIFAGGDLIYDANDGGISVSADAGKSWSVRGGGMVNTMFYAIDVAPTNSNCFGGGTQDNGTLVTGVEEEGGIFRRVLAGDGGWMVYDSTDETHIFGSIQNIEVHRHHANAQWEPAFWKDVSPRIPEEEREQPTVVMIMESDLRHGSKVFWIWAGSSRLWLTTDYGRHWTPVSPKFDGSTITAIEICRTDPQVMFVGTTNGGIFRSTDGGENWTQNLAGPEIPARVITQIAIRPGSREDVAVTVAGTGTASRLIPPANDGLYKDRGPAGAMQVQGFRHVFRSVDCGATWKDIDCGQLPDVAFHSAAFETHAPYRLFVSADCGVWMLDHEADGDAAATWVDISGSLPNVIVSDLVYHHDSRILAAGTFGRGIWRLRLYEEPPPPPSC